MSEIAPGIHRIEEDLGPRFMAQYLLTGSERTLLVDTGLSQTLTEAIAPYAESIGLGVEAIDELFVSHADVDHIGSNRALHERSPRTRICCGELDRRWVESNEAILAENYRWFEPYGFTLGPDVLGFIAQELGGDAPVDVGLRRRRDDPARRRASAGRCSRCPATRSATWASGTPRSGRRSSSTPCSARASATAPARC